MRLRILVEGQTEEQFVKKLLEPYLREKFFFNKDNIGTCPDIRGIKIAKGSGRGGIRTFREIKKSIEEVLLKDKEAYVSSMIDFARLDMCNDILKTVRQLKILKGFYGNGFRIGV